MFFAADAGVCGAIPVSHRSAWRWKRRKRSMKVLRTWERAAYIKARPRGRGCWRRGISFLSVLRPPLFGATHLDFAAIQDAHENGGLPFAEHKGLGARFHCQATYEAGARRHPRDEFLPRPPVDLRVGATLTCGCAVLRRHLAYWPPKGMDVPPDAAETLCDLTVRTHVEHGKSK